MNEERLKTDDSFLLQYESSEILTGRLPFLYRDLCPRCTQTLSDSILSLDAGSWTDEADMGRWQDVNGKKVFSCLEMVNGKLTNILDGLELHTGIFNAAEQKAIVEHVYMLQKKGKNGELKDRTYSAPRARIRGKGRVTMQFGCCYNYAMDKNGNPPGILQREVVNPLPHLFKLMINRLVRWHVLPTTCVPDSCIVNIYEEGNCIPPHIDSHDFVRPFCSVSFLSECNIVFGTNFKVLGPGEFSSTTTFPLPVGSVLVLNGNGADVAKHCVPSVSTKRISITFRKMDESKRPSGFVPEHDLQGIQPLSYEVEKPNRSNSPNLELHMKWQPFRRGGKVEARAYTERRETQSEPRITIQTQQGSTSKRRVKWNCNSSIPPAFGAKRVASEEFVHVWDNKRLNSGHTNVHQQSYPGFEQMVGNIDPENFWSFDKEGLGTEWITGDVVYVCHMWIEQGVMPKQFWLSLCLYGSNQDLQGQMLVNFEANDPWEAEIFSVNKLLTFVRAKSINKVVIASQSHPDRRWNKYQEHKQVQEKMGQVKELAGKFQFIKWDKLTSHQLNEARKLAWEGKQGLICHLLL